MMNTSPPEIHYQLNASIDVEAFITLLQASTLGERRPLHDLECMRGMLENSNLAITAWSGERLVGMARSMTDFHYACYLSELVVHQDYQRLGIGKALLQQTQQQLGPRCKLILIAAPAADTYYEQLKVPFTLQRHPRCWVADS